MGVIQNIIKTGGGENLGNANLTIDVAGIRKLILGGALSSDKFSIRNSADTLDLFQVTGSGAIELNGVANAFTPSIAMKVGGTTRVSYDQYGTRIYGNVYADTMNAHGVNELNVGAQSAPAGMGFAFKPSQGWVRSGAINVVAPTAIANYIFQYPIKDGGGLCYPAFKLSDGQVIKLFGAITVASPVGGATIDAEARTAIIAIKDLLIANGLMLP